MTNEFIIQQLKSKETQLLNELKKVQLALNAFIEENINFSNTNYTNDIIPRTYDSNLTYGSKILFILSSEDKPMLVEEIVESIHRLEPDLDVTRLHKSVGHTLSMLAKYARVRKHPFNRKLKYSI
jgi:hypothetical protein